MKIWWPSILFPRPFVSRHLLFGNDIGANDCKAISHLFDIARCPSHQSLRHFSLPRTASAGAARMENCWRTFIFQWISVDGVEWKSLITEQSTIYDFTSTPSTNIHLNLNFRRFFLTVHAPHTTQSKLPAGQDLAKFKRSQNVLQNVRTCAQRCGMSLLGGGEVKP